MNKYLIIIFLLVLSSCKLKEGNQDIPKKLELVKEITDLKINFNPESTILYDKYLLLFGKDSLFNYNLVAIDLNTNQIDTTYSNQIFNKNISYLLLKNDTLISFFKNENKWKNWNNGWNIYNLNNEWFYTDYKEFEEVIYLFEDENFVVFSLDIGEFGGTVNFYNKKTDKLFACEIYGVNFCDKVNNEYLINGSLAHMDGSIEIIKIENPEKLHYMPDSLNIYKHEKIGKYYDYLEKCNSELLPDTLKNPENLNYEMFKLSSQIISNKLGLKTIIDTSGLLSYATFSYDNHIIHFIQDTTLFIGTFKNDSLFVLDDLYKENFFTYNYSSQIYKNYKLLNFNYWKRNIKSEKLICLIMIGNKLKRYNIF